MADRVVLSPATIGGDKLREAQVGALLSIAAHATTSREPAQVILPTGVGKTTVATLAPFAMAARRVLVVVPGKLIRSQVASSFLDPTRARIAGVLPEDSAIPTVAVAEHRASKEDWAGWKEADVVIGTPSVLSPAYPDVAPMPRRLFDLVIFDEAHHLPATTWVAMLDATDAAAVLLTATPFRRDGRRLPGKIVYTYPLSRAIDRGVFAPVAYRPVDEVQGEDLDHTIARTAASRLRSPEHTEAGSRLLVRSDSVAHARGLQETYSALDVPLGVIVHDTSWKRAEKMRAQVEQGELLGFICVGALTEGFDFPALKIGAYHVPHKTLGPTLQFIGRLSRSSSEITGELLAPRVAVNEETAALYREDVGWQELLPDLVDSAIDHEREVRAFVDDASVGGRLDLPPLSLMPSRSVHIYRTGSAPDLTADPERIADAEVVQKIVHSESSTLAFITRRVQRPRFMRLDTLDAAIYDLHLLTWVDDPGVLFVSTTTEPARRHLLAAVHPAPRRPLTAVDLRRLLDAANFERLFSIGTRAARAQSTRTSYQIRAGPKTEDDLTPADARGWDLGHGMGRSGDGTFGFSVGKSKVWEPGAADSLFAFRKWCLEQARELSAEPDSRRSSKLDLLGISEPLDRFPDHPFVAMLPYSVFSEGLELAAGGELLLPELLELWPDGDQSDEAKITLQAFVRGSAVAEVQCSTDGSVVTTGESLLVRDPEDPSHPEPLSEYLTNHPLTIFFSDGGRVTGDRVALPPPDLAPLASEARHPRSWTNTAITVEFGDPPEGTINVGMATAELLNAEMPFVIQDHLRGELADFIGINPHRLIPEVRLVHCKASGGPSPAARVQDVEELAAQAMRSVHWLAPGRKLWDELAYRLERRPSTQLISGDRAALDEKLQEWSTQPPSPEWWLWLVQPGTSNARLDGAPRVTSLLTAAHAWAASQNVGFRLVCSA